MAPDGGAILTPQLRLRPPLPAHGSYGGRGGRAWWRRALDTSMFLVFLFILSILLAVRFPAAYQLGAWRDVAPLLLLAAALGLPWLSVVAKRKAPAPVAAPAPSPPPPQHHHHYSRLAEHARGSGGYALPTHAHEGSPPPAPHHDFLRAHTGHGADVGVPPLPQALSLGTADSLEGPPNSGGREGGTSVGAGPPPSPPPAPSGAAVSPEGPRHGGAAGVDGWQPPVLPGAEAVPEDHLPAGGARTPAPAPEAAGFTPRTARVARVPKLVLHVAAPKKEGPQALDEAAKRIVKFVEDTFAALKREDAHLQNLPQSLPQPRRAGWPYTLEEAEKEVMSYVRGCPSPLSGPRLRHLMNARC